MGTATKIGGGTGEDFAPAPEGNHLAVCVGVIDLGHQWKSYQDKSGWKHEVRLVWELSEELMSDGRPFALGRTFTLSMFETSNLYKFLKPWLGGAATTLLNSGSYDVKERLGKPCMLTVSHNPDANGKIWANVDAAAPLSKRDAANPPQHKNPLVYYSTDDGPPGPEVPERVAAKILLSREFGGKPGEGQASAPNPNRVGPGPVVPLGIGRPHSAYHPAGAPAGQQWENVPLEDEDGNPRF